MVRKTRRDVGAPPPTTAQCRSGLPCRHLRSALRNVPSRASQCPRCAVHSEHCLSTTLQPATTPINVISVHLLPARNAHRSTLTPPCGPPAQCPRNVGTLHTLQGDACARGRPMTNAGAVRATIKDLGPHSHRCAGEPSLLIGSFLSRWRVTPFLIT